MDKILKLFGALDYELLFVCRGAHACEICYDIGFREAFYQREMLVEHRVDILTLCREIFSVRLLECVGTDENIAVYRAHNAAALGVRSRLRESDESHRSLDERTLLLVEYREVSLSRVDGEEAVARHFGYLIREYAGCVYNSLGVNCTSVRMYCDYPVALGID